MLDAHLMAQQGPQEGDGMFTGGSFRLQCSCILRQELPAILQLPDVPSLQDGLHEHD